MRWTLVFAFACLSTLAPAASAQQPAAAATVTFSATADSPGTWEITGCTFFVHGHHVGANGTVTVLGSPGPYDPVIANLNFTGTPEPDGNGYSFVVGPVTAFTQSSPDSVPYSAFVTWGADVNDTFSGDTLGQFVNVTCMAQPPTASVPFFPTPAATTLALVGSGAAVAGVVALRKRR
ncbi:MAG: hypothetical protein QOE90_2811 [Thermoplasmata archaeon]|jgi:hypothetical protein|nr:hypothetical protein [Thermoplasmata archaeon]